MCSDKVQNPAKSATAWAATLVSFDLKAQSYQLSQKRTGISDFKKKKKKKKKKWHSVNEQVLWGFMNFLTD